MIINLKFNSQTGMLTPMSNYTLAQHNHLADQIVIVSNAPNCKDYNYCLEFVCYNTKNVPKAQYVSEILNYTDEGITFDVPNNLTQYAGFVDVQLTGYSKDSNNVIFKSISKNTKAFSVEGSLSVLDNALSDTPNILTLLQQELDYVREVKETIANDFENLIKNDLGQVLEDFEYCSVEFVFYDKTFCKSYKNNSIINPPVLNLSDDVTMLGWVEQNSGRQWNFDQDRVQGKLTLVANVQSVGVEVQNGNLIGYVGNSDDIYVPYCVDEIITSAIGDSWQVATPKNAVYLPIGMSDCAKVNARFFNQVVGGKDTVEKDGIFYDQQGQRLVGMTAKRLASRQDVLVLDGVQSIQAYAFFGASATKIILPNSLEKVGEYAFGNCRNLQQVTIPSNVVEIGARAFFGCDSNLEVTLTSAKPPTISASTFEVNSGAYAKITVYDWAYEGYQADVNFATITSPLGGVDCIGEIRSLQQTVAENRQAMQTRIDGVEQTVSNNHQAMLTRIDGVEQTVSNNHQAMLTRIDGVERTVSNSHQTTQTRIDGVEQTVSNNHQTTQSRIDGVEQTVSTNKQSAQSQIDVLKKLYSVGSIYMSVSSTSPASLFGGTWERIKDRFLLGAGDSYSAGATGGSATHTLTIDEMPSHTHKQSGGSSGVNNDGSVFQRGYSATLKAAADASVTGGGQAHNNMPPYLAIYIWKRTA